jgi:hypothetical protein
VTIIDAPDGQNATVDAQVLLASESSSTTTVTVTLPPNVSTLAVFTTPHSVGITNTLKCEGVDTLTIYPGSLRYPAPGLGGNFTRYFAVSPANDSSVTLTWSLAPGQAWAVVGMNASQFVDIPALSSLVQNPTAGSPPPGLVVYGANGANTAPILTDNFGRQVILGPSLSTGIVVATTGGVTLLGVPTLGHNFLWGLDVVGITAASIVTVSGTSDGVIALVEAPLGVVNHISLDGFAVADALSVATSIDTASVVLRYAPGLAGY